MCQSKEISHTRGEDEEVKEERKEDLRKRVKKIHNSLH